MSLRPERLARNVVVVASAGTGKTHTLVNALLHALLGLSELRRGEPVHPSRIVATTFSRKAAAEIRERLATTLATLAGGGSTPFDEALAASAAELGVAFGGSAAIARARRALAELGRATLSTLHGFAYAVARRAAFDRGAPPGFTLLDEEETRALVLGAVEEALTSHYREHAEVVRDLTRIARGTDRLADTMVSALLQLEDQGTRAGDARIPEGDRAEIERRFAALVAAAEGVADDPAHRAAATAFLRAHARGEDPSAALGDLFDFRKPRNPSPAIAALAELRDEVGSGKMRDRGVAFGRFWAVRDAILPAAGAFRALLARAQDALHRGYAARAAVGFGAVLAFARDALRDSPALAAEIGGRYDLFVVDEFQDTSRVQRDLVWLLWDANPRARTAGTLPRELRRSGLFIVGDRKQSIYGFRGADVAVFSEACGLLAGDAARRALALADGPPDAPAPTADFFALRTNRRSSPALLRFINAFSGDLLRGGPTAPIRYAPETEDLLPAPGRADDRRPAVTWLRPTPRRDTKKKDDAVLVARAVEERIAEGARFRDVAVLAQTNPMLDAVAHQLALREIPYVVAGRGFYRAQEVGDALAMLRVLVQRDDRAAWLTVLRGPWVSVSDRTLLALTEPHRGLELRLDEWTRGTRRALLDEADREPLLRLVEVVRRLRHAVPRLGPGGALREAARELRFEEALVLLPRGAQRVANVRKLFAFADREPRAEVFLDRCRAAAEAERESEAATFSEADDAVRLLTVHASKGLAFPIVILPEIAYRPPGNPGAMLTLGRDDDGAPRIAARVLDALGDPHRTPSFDAEAAARTLADFDERRRLWYVAVTRAERELVFVGDRKPKNETGMALPSPAPILQQFAAAAHPELRVVEVEDVRTAVRLATAPATPQVELVPLRLSAREVPIATTTLQDFIHCPRRFQLAHLFDLSELVAPAFAIRGDGTAAAVARNEGTFLHALLEVVDPAAFGEPDPRPALDDALRRAGLDPQAPFAGAAIERAARFLRSEYAASVRASGAKVLREHAFVVPIGADEEGPDALTVVLRGAIDLLVLHPDGAVDVIDYKRARGPEVEPYVPQLAMYALAAARSASDGKGKVRAGIVFLGGTSPAAEPRFAKLPRLAKLTRELLDQARALQTARRTERFPRVAEARCEELRCGYRALCHPPTRGQLGLFGR